MNSGALNTDPAWSMHTQHVPNTSGSYVGITTTGTNTSGTTWITNPNTYTITGTGASTTWGSTGITETADCCRFCDKQVEVGIIIQSKGSKKTVVCVTCAKDYMGSEKMKEIFDLVEPLATMAELAKG